MNDVEAALQVLKSACQKSGIDIKAPVLIRAGENTLFRLAHRIVARVGRSGQLAAAAKEVQVSRWLQSLDFPVVKTVTEIEQPVEVAGRAVTFWREFPQHRQGTLPELAIVLRMLHHLPRPDFELPKVEPFVRLRERMTQSSILNQGDKQWLGEHLTAMEARFAELPTGLPWCAIHGDSWQGNLAVTNAGLVLHDLERFAIGPPEWDLTSVAVDFATFGATSAAEWAEFCEEYAQDVTTWPGFATLRDIRELRKVTFAIQAAETRSREVQQARYRLACIQGLVGDRPWGWQGVG
jgi:aminoglycoside phosphotransferase (APT) family kinase protein